MSDLNYIDYAIITIIGISTLVAYFRGLITEVMSFLVWAVAFGGAIVFYEDVAQILPNILGNYGTSAVDTNLQNLADPMGESMIITALSFIITFLGILFLAGLFNLLVSLFIRHFRIAFADRILGMGFGFLRGVLAVLIAGTFIVNSDLSEQPLWKDAKLSPTVTEGVKKLSVLIPEKFITQINTKNLVNRMKDAGKPKKNNNAPQIPDIPSLEKRSPVTQEDTGIITDESQHIEYIENID